MIQELKLRNFKCFSRLSLPLRAFTLLSGLNSGGKSSVLQSLLLLRQSAAQGRLEKGELALNGEWVQLGGVNDILREDAEGDARLLDIVLEYEDDTYLALRFQASTAETVQQPERLLRLPDGESFPEGWKQRIPMSNCRYLAGERISPQSFFPLSDEHVELRNDVGIRGEFCAHYLALHGDDPLPIPALGHPDAQPKGRLRWEVEAWLGIVSPGVGLSAEIVPGVGVAKLGFTFPGPYGRSAEYRPTHVGFGLTHVLPILVLILTAKPGDLLLVENPESHLHPKGQIALARLLAQAANNGVQLIIETHSDHILNGIRLAVQDTMIDHNKVFLHHFSISQDSQGARRHNLVTPEIDKQGRLSEWPEGFFDQWDNTLRRLLVS